MFIGIAFRSGARTFRVDYLRGIPTGVKETNVAEKQIQQPVFVKAVMPNIAIAIHAFVKLTIPCSIKYPDCKTDLQIDCNSFNTHLNIPSGGYIIMVYIILLCKKKRDNY